MKTVHHYCTSPFDSGFYEEPRDDKRIVTLLTWSRVRYAIEMFATGIPPFKLTVPREFITTVFETWEYPKALVQVAPKPNRTDMVPYDTCELQFEDCLVVFHCLRVAPYYLGQHYA